MVRKWLFRYQHRENLEVQPIKVPTSWRELHARGQKLLRLRIAEAEIPERLGVSAERWREIVVACGQRVVALEMGEELRCH